MDLFSRLHSKFQHTAARRRLGSNYRSNLHTASVSTHSRPKAAGRISRISRISRRFQHTAARRRLALLQKEIFHDYQFQHTAARRRLESTKNTAGQTSEFQHTAARRRLAPPSPCICSTACFNTQPPEGGWTISRVGIVNSILFQHTAARRRLVFDFSQAEFSVQVSTHSRPKAAG